MPDSQTMVEGCSVCLRVRAGQRERGEIESEGEGESQGEGGGERARARDVFLGIYTISYRGRDVRARPARWGSSPIPQCPEIEKKKEREREREREREAGQEERERERLEERICFFVGAGCAGFPLLPGPCCGLLVLRFGNVPPYTSSPY